MPSLIFKNFFFFVIVIVHSFNLSWYFFYSMTTDLNGKAIADLQVKPPAKKIIKITFGKASGKDEAATGTSKKVTLKRSSGSSSQSDEKTGVSP